MATGRPAGRPAKPVEAHRLAGNPSKKQLPMAPVMGEGITGADEMPEPPAHLGEAGRTMWAHVWEVARNWMAPGSDQTVVLLLCEAMDDYTTIRAQLNSGEVERYYTMANGSMVTHPLVNQLKDLRIHMTSWLGMIGFSPSDRSRLGLAEVRVRDEIDDLTRRRNERATRA